MRADSRLSLRRQLRPALLVTSVAALAGCHGHHHDHNVSLSTKEDVLRELGNMAAFVDFSGVDGNQGTAARVLPAAKSRFAGIILQPKFAGADARTAPKAATVYDCDSGSYSAETLSGTYTFSLFDSTSRDVSIYREDNDHCVFEYNGGLREIYDGHYEVGDYTPQTGDHYAYLRYGSGDTVYRYREELSGDADYPTEEELLGELQRRDNSTSSEVRGEDFRYHFSAPDYEASVTLGKDDVLKILVADTGLSIDGSARYETSTCDGGTLHYTTTTPLLLPGDGTAQGALKMESGNDSATVTVEGSGGATVLFANGSSVELTAAEIQAALAETPCASDSVVGPL